MGTIATLAGVPLLGHESVGWRFTRGTTPYQRIFEVTEDGYRAIMSAVGANAPGQSSTGGLKIESSSGSTFASDPDPVGVELRIEVDGHETLSVKNLLVISDTPASAPYLRAVVVTDIRFLWSRRVVEGSYNIRRRTGDRRWVNENQRDKIINFARAAPADDVDFAIYSLKGEETKWVAADVIDDILNQVTKGKFEFSKALVKNELPVEGLELNDRGDSAIDRVLQLVPGLSLYIDNNGVAVVTSDYDGSDEAEIKNAKPPIVGSQMWSLVDLSVSRPSAIELFFEIEEEFRFNFLETETGQTMAGGEEDSPYLENVLPLPDPETTLNGNKLAQGTWAKIDDTLFAAWNADYPATVVYGGRTANLPQFTLAVLRDNWFTKTYNLYYEAGVLVDARWARRVSAALAHYRQTFRISKRWLDRLRSFRANRVSIIDPETGTRAPADVYTNYTIIPTKRRLALTQADPSRQAAFQIIGYADNIRNGILAQARVEIVDQEQGIIRIQYVGDAFGDTAQVVPSAVRIRPELAALAKSNVTFISQDPRDGVPSLENFGALSVGHKLAVVLTATPAAPAGKGRLIRVTVGPGDVSGILPSSAAAKLGKCLGPPWQVRVGGGVLTAKFGYQDDSQDEAMNAVLGRGDRDVNRLLNKAEIEATARAIAASIYTGQIDRYEGTNSSAIDPNRKPVGRIKGVQHELAPDGSGITVIDIPPDIKPIDFYGLLPPSVRRTLLRLVQP